MSEIYQSATLKPAIPAFNLRDSFPSTASMWFIPCLGDADPLLCAQLSCRVGPVIHGVAKSGSLPLLSHPSSLPASSS